jgi:putative PIN family toxin of toxin-antitoxin system
MRVVVDTNIVFSAILNSNSKIAQILLTPRNILNFYSTEQLLTEIEEHKSKIKKLSGYSTIEVGRVIQLITSRIRFINPQLIPNTLYNRAEQLTHDVDIDDTEFIALTDHIKGIFWSGDKELQNGLAKKGWTKFITTDELYRKQFRKK